MESKKNNQKKVIGIVAGVLIVCGIGLAIGLLNRVEPNEDSLAADTQNKVMTSQEESVANTQLLEPTHEMVSDTVKEEPEIDTTLTGDSILSSGLSLREAWGIYNEFKKSNEGMDLSAEENNEFLNNVLFDLGTTLAQLEYCNNAGMFNEQQQVAQTLVPSEPIQQPSSKGGTDVDGDGIMDYDDNGNLIKGSSLDKNNNGIADSIENEDPERYGYATFEDIPADHRNTECYYQETSGQFKGRWFHVRLYDIYNSYEEIPLFHRNQYMQLSDGKWALPSYDPEAIKHFYDSYGD